MICDLLPPAQPIYFYSPFSPASFLVQTTEISHLFSALHTCLLSIQFPNLHHNFPHIFIYVPVSLAQLLGYFHLNPAISLIAYCIPSPPTSELTEICMCHVCQQILCTNFNSRIFLNYTSAPCTTMKLCFCNDLFLAKLLLYLPVSSNTSVWFPLCWNIFLPGFCDYFFFWFTSFFQVSIRQLPSSVSNIFFLCLRSSSLSGVFINI